MLIGLALSSSLKLGGIHRSLQDQGPTQGTIRDTNSPLTIKGNHQLVNTQKASYIHVGEADWPADEELPLFVPPPTPAPVVNQPIKINGAAAAAGTPLHEYLILREAEEAESRRKLRGLDRSADVKFEVISAWEQTPKIQHIPSAHSTVGAFHEVPSTRPAHMASTYNHARPSQSHIVSAPHHTSHSGHNVGRPSYVSARLGY